MNLDQIQQGDILALRKVVLPADCKRVKHHRGAVLGEGETEGHFHRTDDGNGVALMEAPTGERYLVNETDAAISVTHEEHSPIVVEPGVWQVGHVQEYDYFADMERQVID
jgi:hypothetical protein